MKTYFFTLLVAFLALQSHVFLPIAHAADGDEGQGVDADENEDDTETGRAGGGGNSPSHSAPAPYHAPAPAYHAPAPTPHYEAPRHYDTPKPSFQPPAQRAPQPRDESGRFAPRQQSQPSAPSRDITHDIQTPYIPKTEHRHQDSSGAASPRPDIVNDTPVPGAPKWHDHTGGSAAPRPDIVRDTPVPSANDNYSRPKRQTPSHDSSGASSPQTDYYRNTKNGHIQKPDDIAGVTKDGRQLRARDAATYTNSQGEQVIVHDKAGNLVPSDHREAPALAKRQMERDRYINSGASSPPDYSTRTRSSVDDYNQVRAADRRADRAEHRAEKAEHREYKAERRERNAEIDGYIAGSIFGRPYDPYYYNNRYYYDGCYGWCGGYFYSPPPLWMGPVNVIVEDQVVVRDHYQDDPDMARQVAAEVLRQQQEAEAQKKVAPPKDQAAELAKQKKEEFDKILASSEVKAGGIFKIPDSEKEITVRLHAAAGDSAAGEKCKIEYSGTLVVTAVEGEGDAAIAVATYSPPEKPDGTECPAGSLVRISATELSGFNARFKADLENAAKQAADESAKSPPPDMHANVPIASVPAAAIPEKKKCGWWNWLMHGNDCNNDLKENDPSVAGSSREVKPEQAAAPGDASHENKEAPASAGAQ